MATLELMVWHQIATRSYPTSSTGLFKEIETTLLFLIEQGDKHDVDMKKVLNWKNKTGETLLSKAVKYSEKISFALFDREVVINVINCRFKTPLFKVNDL